MRHSSISVPRLAALSIAITIVAASIATAQTREPTSPAGTTPPAAASGVPAFASQLQGKNVWITTDGARVRGRVTTVSSTGLVLVEGSVPKTIPYSQIVRVEKSTHRKRNGSLIGLAAGAGLGAWGTVLCACVGPLFGVGGLGAAAGMVVGAIINDAKSSGDVIYDARRRSTTMALAPILSPAGKGMAFSMTWR